MILPARLQELVEFLFDFLQGNLTGNLAGILRDFSWTHKTKASKYRGAEHFSRENLPRPFNVLTARWPQVSQFSQSKRLQPTISNNDLVVSHTWSFQNFAQKRSFAPLWAPFAPFRVLAFALLSVRPCLEQLQDVQMGLSNGA